MKVFFWILVFFTYSIGLFGQTDIWLDDFSTDGEGNRYTTSTSFTNANGHFFRGVSSSFTSGSSVARSRINTPSSNAFFSALRFPVDAGQENGDLVTRWINISNYINLDARLDVAANDEFRFETFCYANKADLLDFQYEIDGSGTWVDVFKLRSGPGCINNVQLYQDDNLDDLITGGVETNLIDTNFQTISNLIGVVGDSIRFRIYIQSTFVGEEILFDNLNLKGDFVGSIPSDVPRIYDHHCNQTVNNLADRLWCSKPSNTDFYEWRINRESDVDIVNTGTWNRLYLTQIPNITYDTVFSVAVRRDSAGVKSDWSDAWYQTCQTVVGSPETPTFRGVACGSSIEGTGVQLLFNGVGSATDYRVKVNGPDGISINVLGSTITRFRISDFGLYSAGNYYLSLSSEIGGSFTSFTDSCLITVSETRPRIDITNCPTDTIHNLNYLIRSEAYLPANPYRFRAAKSGGGLTTRTNTSPNYRMVDFGTTHYNGTWEVRAGYTLDGGDSPWGNICNVIVGNAETQVGPLCGGSAANTSTVVFLEAISGVDSFEINYTGPVSGSIFSENSAFRFSDIPSVATGTYNVQINCFIGGSGQGLGTSCSVDLLSVPAPDVVPDPIGSPDEIIVPEPEMLIFPNPAQNVITIEFDEVNEKQRIQLTITDQYGNLVLQGSKYNMESIDVSSLRPGVYSIIVITEKGHILRKPLVIR